MQCHIACLLASLSFSERAWSALDCFGDRCNTAVGLDEYGTASYLGAHLPLILTEIAAPASSLLPITIQVTPSPPSGSIILLLRQGATIIAQSADDGLGWDSLSPQRRARLNSRLAPSGWNEPGEKPRLLVSGICGCVASHQIAPRRTASHRAAAQSSSVQCRAIRRGEVAVAVKGRAA